MSSSSDRSTPVPIPNATTFVPTRLFNKAASAYNVIVIIIIIIIISSCPLWDGEMSISFRAE